MYKKDKVVTTRNFKINMQFQKGGKSNVDKTDQYPKQVWPLDLQTWNSVLNAAINSIGGYIVCPNSTDENYFEHEITFRGLVKSGDGLFLVCRCTHCGADFKKGDEQWFNEHGAEGIIFVPHLTSAKLRLQKYHQEAREEYKAEHGRYPEEDGITIMVNI